MLHIIPDFWKTCCKKKILLYAVMWYEMLTYLPYQNHRQFSISHFQCQPLLSRCNLNLLDNFLHLHILVSLLSRAKSHWLLVDLSMGHLKWHKLIMWQMYKWYLILNLMAHHKIPHKTSHKHNWLCSFIFNSDELKQITLIDLLQQ